MSQDKPHSSCIVSLRFSDETHSENTDGQLSNSDEPEDHGQTSLPVASPINEETDIEGGVELIVDGVVISDERLNSKSFWREKCLVSILIISVVAITFAILCRPWASRLVDNSTQPSLAPSTSFPPTSIIDYENHIKEIVVNVSSEEALNNSSSIQYKLLKVLVGELPYLIDAGIIQLNDTKRISQRYSLLVVIGSGSRALLSPGTIETQQQNPFDECHLPFIACNENFEITSIFFVNKKTTNGGGIIATEIGTLLQLRQISFSNLGAKGTIPSEIGNLKHLRTIDLSDNLLTSSIPTEIWQLQNIELIDFKRNSLERTLSSQVGNLKKMIYLDLSQNMFNGSIPLELESMNALKGLKLQENDFTGNLDYFCERKPNFTTANEILIPVEINQFSYVLESGCILDCN